MAIPKKGSRKIVVDGVDFRWRIRWKPTIFQQEFSDACLCAAAELYENPKSILHISFLWARYKLYPSFEVKPVTPKHIESMIKKAISNGWIPDKSDNFEIINEGESCD